MDAVRAGPFGQLFSPESFIFGKFDRLVNEQYRRSIGCRQQLGERPLH
jgi:hypothetical protein